MRVVRPFKCCHGWFCCAPDCGLEMRVEAPPGNVVGYIGQMYVNSDIVIIHYWMNLLQNNSRIHSLV